MLENIEKPELDTVELRSDGKYGKFVLARWNAGMVSPWAIACGVYCSPHCPVWL